MVHNIVVVGGNMAGVATTHYILLHVIPTLTTPTNTYTVTLISPSDRTMFKIGSPRVLVKKDLIDNNALFASIPAAFKAYPADIFTFVQGEAVALDETTKSISVKGEKNSEIHYDSLVIATGTTAKSPLWGLIGDWSKSHSALQEVHAALPKAASILISGGGAVGVETAGEIAHAYKNKNIMLLSGTTRLLARLKDLRISAAAQSQLASSGVTVTHGVRVVSSSPGKSGKTTLTLSDGSTKEVDLYLDCTGGTPNTAFLPSHWLEPSGQLSTSSTTLRATSAPAGIYGVGDVASHSQQSVMEAGNSIAPLGYSIHADLAALAKVKPTLKEKKLEQMTKDFMVVPIGPKGGVGAVFGWKLPSFFVWLIKSRTFFMDKAPTVADSSAVAKA